MISSLLLALLVAGSPVFMPGDPSVTADDGTPADQSTLDVLNRYLEANGALQVYLRGLSMDVEMEGAFPGLKKTGKMQALRHISRLGRITYNALTFQGDNTVKKDIIARYMQAEVEATTGQSGLALTPDNYKFKYRGLFGSGDWQLHLFELTPKQKRVGLFKGYLWVEARTGLPVREQGRFVKSPSIFLKRIEFVRDYEIRTGVSLPKQISSTIDTRLVGKAELTIRYSNYAKPEVANGDRASHGVTPAQ